MTEFLASVIVRHRVSLRESDDSLQRTIQYAGTYRFISERSGILNAPLSRGMTAECSGGVIPSTICKPPFHAHALISLGIHRTRRQRLELALPHQLRQRPYGSTPDQRAGVIQQAFGFDGQGAVAAVADRDQHVADEPVAADALDRRFCEQRAKRRIVEPYEIGQRSRAPFITRGEFCFAPGLRELIPRADGEAIVAAIDAVADRLTEFVRDRTLVFDGEIGNAAPGIELVGCWKRRGRADIEAGLARAAMVGLGVIARKVRRGEDRAEKQP